MTPIRLAAALLASFLAVNIASAADSSKPGKLLLWPEGAPGAMANGGEETVRVTEQGDHVVSNVHAPSITVYLPKKNSSGAAVIIVPGGGHRELWTDHEGHTLARFFNEQGIAAFVLYYRLERAPNSTYKIEEHALADLQQAIRLVRSNAQKWSLDPNRIGSLGFSAGGQLVLLSAMRYEAGELGTRPDFVALVYPGGSPEIKFDANTPPMFLLAGSEDRPGVLATLTQAYTALREARVPAELHLYDGVPHGFGVRASLTGPVARWPTQFVEWLKVRKIL